MKGPQGILNRQPQVVEAMGRGGNGRGGSTEVWWLERGVGGARWVRDKWAFRERASDGTSGGRVERKMEEETRRGCASGQ